MNYHKSTALLLLCWCGLVLFSGCGEESPAEVRDFRVKYFRHKLFDVDFVDSANGWVCGDYGLIWKTADGGQSWKPQKSGTILPLRGISFSDVNNGWAVGDQGTIVHTADGGKTWERQNSGIQEHLQEVTFLNNQTGFTIGVFASFLRTEDGGQHWTDISAWIKEPEKEQQFFITEGEGAPAEEEAPASEMGQLDFLEEGMPVLEPLLNRIYFLDDQMGWIAAEEGNIFHTSDGGKSWQKQKSGTSEDLFSVYFKNAQEGWITGLNGTLLYTQDGGETWTRQECPIEESLFDIVVTRSLGYAVGNAAAMIRSNDGGKTWEAFTPGDIVLYSWFRAIQEIEGKFVAVGGLGTILILQPGSDDWRQVL